MERVLTQKHFCVNVARILKETVITLYVFHFPKHHLTNIKDIDNHKEGTDLCEMVNIILKH